VMLRSSDFQHNNMIAPKFTCDGIDLSPQLFWEDSPRGTKSYALTVVDPDAPGGEFIHWLICDIPFDTKSIDQGRVPKGAKQVQNDFGKKDYGGPCPPSGTHRYIFTIYALDVTHLEGVDQKNFFKMAEKHTIAKAELIGLYSRRK
jgi:Raf kinase inhibitor-like YbhB/YbcL family protein